MERDGRPGDAGALLREHAGELRAASLDDDEVAAEAHDLERLAGTFEQGLAQSADIKHMKQMVRDGLQSRFSVRNRYRRNE